jgi:Rod binding domain-containing protein
MESGFVGAVGTAGQMEQPPSPRLVRAAHEFEGQMMKELLKPMTGGDALAGGDGDDDSSVDSSGALGEFASEALGQALSERGGFGIADRIVRELSHSGPQRESVNKVGNSPTKAAIKRSVGTKEMRETADRTSKE